MSEEMPRPADPTHATPDREVVVDAHEDGEAAITPATTAPDALAQTGTTAAAIDATDGNTEEGNTNGGNATAEDVNATVVPEITAPPTTGLSIGMWVSMVIGAVVLVLLLVFIVQNNVPTEIHYFGWSFSLPLGVALLLAAVGGLLIAGVIGSIRILQLSHRLRKVGKALK